MRIEIVIERIEQIFYVQPGRGVALDAEAALEEQRVGILGARREPPEVLGPSANDDVGATVPGRKQAAGVDREIDAACGIGDIEPYRLAVKRWQARDDALAAQQMIEHARQYRGVYAIGNRPKRQVQR